MSTNGLLSRASAIKNETTTGANTASRVGGLLVDIVNTLSLKQDAASGKDLSSNDYTTAEKNKLFALPGSVYSKVEVDSKLAIVSGGVVISRTETEAGEFRATGAAGEIAQPVYACFKVMAALPQTSGTVKDYLLSEDPLGCNLYFSVDSFVVSTGEQIRSEIFPSMYEISKVYVDTDYHTHMVIRCLETTTQNLSAYINVRYIKPYAEKVELTLQTNSAVNIDNVSVKIPELKYDKKALVSFTTDDSNASSFCRVWAAINGRPVSNKFYHVNQLSAGDIPDEIVDTTLTKTLGMTDGCGNERRFHHGVAIWPYSEANGQVMMDSTNPVDPTATNLYRFMTPYLQWPDLAEMIKYGVGVYYHNIGTTQFGDDHVVDNVVSGLRADCLRSVERIGRGIKILARPDGNNTYIDAAAQSGQILFSVAENAPAVDMIPFAMPTRIYKMTGLRFFPVASGSSTEQDVVKAAFEETYQANKESRTWFHFCCHTATLDWVNLLVWFNDTYGKEGSDDIWFANLDEVYEYMYTRSNTLIRKSADGNNLHITAYIPKGQYFYFPEFSLLVNGLDTTTQVIPSENVTGLSFAVHNTDLMLNVNTDATLPALCEECTAKYERTEKLIDKTDALYFVAQLKASSLKTTFEQRIAAITPGVVTLLSVAINNNAATTTSRTVSIVPSYNGSPTHYRIGETADLSTVTWISYAGGEIAYTLSTDYGTKNLYVQLKNGVGESSVKSDSISYEEASTEISLTALSISGASTLQIGSSAQLSIAYTPANTTQTGVDWESSSVANATVDTTGRVAAIAAGSVTITARSKVNTSIATTHLMSITQTQEDAGKSAVLIANYSWVDLKVDHLLDATLAKYLNISNANYSAYVATDNKLYDMNSGELLAGWSRMNSEEKKAYYGLTSLDSWSMAAAYNPDLTDLFATPLEYQYAYKYNAALYPVVGWNIPNGTYRVSVLTSTTQADLSSTGHIKINNVEQVLPSISFQNNKQWMTFENIQVADGKMAIMMYGDANKKMGFNVIKIEKTA